MELIIMLGVIIYAYFAIDRFADNINPYNFMKWLIAAEEITTGNLLPNGTGSASNLQSVDTNNT
jgi:hypothetical protein